MLGAACRSKSSTLSSAREVHASLDTGGRKRMTEALDMRTETNRLIIRQAFDAWHDGTGAITDMFAPGMVWRVEGHSAASGQYGSKQQFIDEVLRPFGARFSTSDPFRPVVIRGVYADGDTVIVLWDGRGITTDGRVYENSYAWFMKLHDGKVVDSTAFFDSISFNDLWTRVQPRT
jgi:ketosteroid isomerase-like protein